MRKRMWKRIGFVIAGLALLFGCTLVPHIDLGVDFDYYGGSFHVRPNASVGVYGRP